MFYAYADDLTKIVGETSDSRMTYKITATDDKFGAITPVYVRGTTGSDAIRRLKKFLKNDVWRQIEGRSVAQKWDYAFAKKLKMKSVPANVKREKTESLWDRSKHLVSND